MVKVCDAIMGSGKTSATIKYINEHPEERFLYLTPFLNEANRIKEGCPDARLVEPDKKHEEYSFKKVDHTAGLLKEGRNVASTHSALMYYKPEMYETIGEMEYTVIIDETVSLMTKCAEFSYSDVKMAEAAGEIYENSQHEYVLSPSGKYEFGLHSKMFRIMQSRPLMCFKDTDNGSGGSKRAFFWLFPPDIFKKAKQVILLTYLFPGSEMESYFKINDIEYQYIGVRPSDSGCYEFCDDTSYRPEYVKNLKSMIHICQEKKLNELGNNRNALSINWYNTNKDKVDELRKKIRIFMRERNHCSQNEKLCAHYAKRWGCIREKGYYNRGLAFNSRATNDYRESWVVAYPVNVFANRDVLNYYIRKGCGFDDERYALSTMVQFVWRSAIRDGKEIQLYVPSKRMRGLFTDWLEEVSGG